MLTPFVIINHNLVSVNLLCFYQCHIEWSEEKHSTFKDKHAMFVLHYFNEEFLQDFRIVVKLIQHNTLLDELVITTSINYNSSVYDSSSAFETTWL